MALLFFGGVMNLWWIGGLALFVLIEKISAAGPLIGYAIGLGLVFWGFGLLFI
jgi:predicted metal-binding membrane protein